ncbi:MAG: ATP-dependent Clp protease ATP-binding subunit [Patescibacteria group bacterium]
MAESKDKNEQFVDSLQFKAYGRWWSGLFLYCELNLKPLMAALQKSKNRLDRLVNGISYAIAVFGWISLVLWFYQYGAHLINSWQRLLLFWREQHVLVLFFLLSLWFDLFLIYRRSERRAKTKKINYKYFKELLDNPKPLTDASDKYNVAQALNEDSRLALQEAYALASRFGQPEVRAIHLFRVLLKNKDVQNVFIRLKVDAKKLVEKVEKHLVDPSLKESADCRVAPALQEALILSFIEAHSLKLPSIDVLSLLMFCDQKDEMLAEILFDLEINHSKIANVITWFRVNQQLIDSYRKFRKMAALKPGSGMNRSYTAVATPTLDHFSHDLTLAAKYGRLEICVGRKKEIEAIFEAFASGHNGVLLVGQPGVGKKAIVDGVAQLMVQEDVPKFLKDKRLVEIDSPALVSGSSPTQAQERLLTAINEVNRAGNIILYISNIENLVGISDGGEGSLDLSEVLAEAVQRQNVFCIATATTENYSKHIENRSLGQALSTIGVKEPLADQAIQIVESKVAWFENKYGIFFAYDAIEAAVDMSHRYLHDRFLPVKAIDLLQAAASNAAKAAKEDPERSICTREEVAQAIAEMTGIPANKISASEGQKLLQLEESLHKRMIGQEEAVEAVSNALRRARAELRDSQRPIASFLFLGPTGVGKTELAKTVSEVYFGNEAYMIRLDMSEYQYADSVRKMIGDVNGITGYLTEAVRKKPFALVLLDEVEKAHPDILNLFLQMLDDGRLTDGQGRTISFSESIIIATSNVGALYIQQAIKEKADISVIKQNLIDNELNKVMRPELINRFDGIIVFKPLSEDNVFAITKLMLKKFKKNLEGQGIDLKADREGVLILSKLGYDPKFGARPLRRLLQERIEDVVAVKIINGELKRRDAVLINGRGEVEIEKAPAL